MATSGHGGVVPYVGVCVLIAGLAIADGTAQGALVGDLCFMDPTYIQVILKSPIRGRLVCKLEM